MSALRPVTKLVTNLIGSRVTRLEGLARAQLAVVRLATGGVELVRPHKRRREPRP